jgi:hypothetical protein
VTPEEFKAAIENVVSDGWYTGDWHEEADAIMCELLKQLGYGEGIEIYLSRERWFE